MTKTRPYGLQRVIPERVIWVYTQKNGVKQTYTRAQAASYDRRFGSASSITSQSGRDGRFRPTKHTQEVYTVKPLSTLPGPLLYANTAATGSTIADGRLSGMLQDVHRQKYPQFIAACNSVAVSTGSVQWNALAESAVQNMMPSFTGSTSLVNFILELKDFRDVFKYLATGFSRKLNQLDRFRVRNNKGVETVITVDFKKGRTLEKLSRQYLGVQFGWLPLYRDVVALYKSVRDFEVAFREMVRRELKPQQRYWGSWIPGTDLPRESYYYTALAGPEGGWIGPQNTKSVVRIAKEATQGVRYHATMRYRYKLPAELFGVGGKAKAFLDLLGVNRNPAILWNAIPFSFIVDWVVNVSKYLERLKLDNIQIQTEILDFCHSARSERTVNFHIGGENIIDPSPGHMRLAENLVDSCRKVVYERRVGIPNFRAAILTSGLNMREFSLGGALLGARRGY